MNETLAVLVPALGSALLHFLWQGTLLGLLAALALGLLRNARAQARYAVACAALLAMLLAPLATLALQLHAAAPSADAVATLQAAAALPVPASYVDQSGFAIARSAPALLPWLVLAWAVGAAGLALHMAGGLYWVARLRRHAWTGDDTRWQVAVDRLAPGLGLRIAIPLRLTDAACSPLAIGWWRPMVLLPAALTLRMPAPLLEALIAHELAHVRRHDYLVNLLQRIAEALLFYHPATWWLSRRIRCERELIADDLAAAALGDRRSLALALTELDHWLAGEHAGIAPRFAPAAQGGQLMSRIQQLLRPRRNPVGTVGAGIVLPLLGLVIAGTALYAHAAGSPQATPQATTQTDQGLPPAPPAPPVPPAAPEPPPAPPAPLAAPADAPLPPPAPALPAQPPAPPALPIAINDGDGNGYVLVRKGEANHTMSGSREDLDVVHRLQQRIDGDFLLVRNDGDRYVVRDPAVLARVEANWKPLRPLDARMDELQSRMQPHQARMEALSAEMQRLAPPAPSPEMEAASGRLEELAGEQARLAGQQARLSLRLRKADDAERAGLERRIDALAAQMEALSGQMEEQAATIDRHAQSMRVQGARMDEVGMRMQAAGEPMQAIGKDMEAVGAQIGRAARKADADTRKEIDAAFRRGLAEPVAGL